MRYTVGQVCQELGINIRTLYRWEATELIPRAKRVNRRRIYSQEDLERIKAAMEA